MTSPGQAHWLEWRFPGDAPWDERVRAGRRRYLWLIAGSAAVIVVPFLWVLGRIDHSIGDGGASADPPLWRDAASWSLLIAGLALVVLGLVRQARDNAYAATATSPLWGLTMRQRRAVMRTIAGDGAVHPVDVPFLRDVAGRAVVGQSGALRLYAAVVLMQTGGLIRAPEYDDAATLALCLGCFGWLLMRTRQARRFLARSPS